MKKRSMLIVGAAVLGLGVGFYLYSAAAGRGVYARALISCLVDLRPKFYRLLAPVYAVLPRHTAVVMLGDSITDWTDWNALLPSFDVANRGISGDTIEGALRRIGSIVAMRPRCAAIMLGVNDLLLKQSVQRLSQNYSTIVDILNTSGSIVIVQSILTTSKNYAWLNASVVDANRSLAEMCKRSGRCLYLNLNSTIASTGAIADSADGVHIGPNSYKIWASTLTPVLNANCR
jgi:lysophospholipase L1-like esterase